MKLKVYDKEIKKIMDKKGRSIRIRIETENDDNLVNEEELDKKGRSIRIRIETYHNSELLNKEE